MTRIRTLPIALAITLLTLLGAASANHEGYGVPGMVDPAAMMSMSPDQWNATMNQYNQQMDAFVQQQMSQAQQASDRAANDLQRFFIDYYRQRTNDWATPDAQALVYGDRLYCQDNPAQCQQNLATMDAWSRSSAEMHQQRMNDTAAWGRNALAAGQASSAALDASQQSWMDQQAGIDQNNRQWIDTVIWEQSLMINPQTGQGFMVPNSPQGTSFSNGLSYNPATGGWSQNGTALQPGSGY